MSLTPEVLASDFRRGEITAPLVVVHYGDFECPYSGALAPLLNQLKAELGEQMCLVFRYFPLSDLHPHAMQAALAAEAAHQSGDQFWEMHDLLFQNQDALSDDDLLDYAGQLGVDIGKFKAAMSSDEARANVEESVESGHRSGAHGTPTLFINGEFHDNDEQLWKSSRLTPLIQAELPDQ